jgi:hypothetical protein
VGRFFFFERGRGRFFFFSTFSLPLDCSLFSTFFDTRFSLFRLPPDGPRLPPVPRREGLRLRLVQGAHRGQRRHRLEGWLREEGGFLFLSFRFRGRASDDDDDCQATSPFLSTYLFLLPPPLPPLSSFSFSRRGTNEICALMWRKALKSASSSREERVIVGGKKKRKKPRRRMTTRLFLKKKPDTQPRPPPLAPPSITQTKQAFQGRHGRAYLFNAV